MNAKHNTHLQVYPGHYLSKTGTICLANRVARGVYFLIDPRLYPFLTLNRPGTPVFGYSPVIIVILILK